MTDESDDESNEWTTGQTVAAGLGLVGAFAAAGFAIYSALNEEKSRQGESSRRTDSCYKANKCVSCDSIIIDNAKRLSCGHVIHTDCLRSLIINGASRCPMCLSKLTSEDLYQINKRAIDNRANQKNPNHVPSGPGRPAGYSGTGDRSDLNNHSNQFNPNNQNYQGGQRNRSHHHQL